MERVSTVIGALKYLEDTMRFDGKDEFAETADDAKVCIRLLVSALRNERERCRMIAALVHNRYSNGPSVRMDDAFDRGAADAAYEIVVSIGEAPDANS